MQAKNDKLMWNDWQTLGPPDRVGVNSPLRTQLFDTDLTVRWEDGVIRVDYSDTLKAVAHVQVKHGWIWVCLGEPYRDVIDLPDWNQAGRVLTHPGSFGVGASALRCVENFLDMGHFPFVHTDYLGQEPNTEVVPYKVRHDEVTDELIASDCQFWQPLAAANSTGGLDIRYEYRVLHPHIAMLKKTSAIDTSQYDYIVLALQPCTEVSCVGHTWLWYLDDVSMAAPISQFQQIIFGQDRPILQSHRPQRLPLTTGLEIPVKIDAMSVAYRRWLRAKNVQYGALN
ncbi:MAG TPA: aromatic ring-hydroxylating dioxygenase subunit alpha [Burkholderiaceae bacterium]|nr:aromatic ring-hydroxylating dioxygenase subunit alpha [Burkholderiaceae bacterium]